MKKAILMAGFFALAIQADASPTVLSNNKATQASIAPGPGPQAFPSFMFLRGHRQGRGGFGLQWNMNTTAGVQNFIVQATYEDPSDPYSNWETLGTVPNSRFNIFRYYHTGMYPGIITYRIVAVMRNQATEIVSPLLTRMVGQ